MRVTVIDGLGGGVGKLIVEKIRSEISDTEIIGVGTNVAATLTMQKAGADHSATGENAVVVACRSADAIIGPVGIVIADSLFGEITAKMAAAVAQSSAVRILIPINLCDNYIVGVSTSNMTKLVGESIEKLKTLKK